MPKGYWIVRVDIADQEKYKEYVAANAAPFKEHGARFLVRAGRFEAVEGGSRARNAVIEFPRNCASPCRPSTSSSSRGTSLSLLLERVLHAQFAMSALVRGDARKIDEHLSVLPLREALLDSLRFRLNEPFAFRSNALIAPAGVFGLEFYCHVGQECSLQALAPN